MEGNILPPGLTRGPIGWHSEMGRRTGHRSNASSNTVKGYTKKNKEKKIGKKEKRERKERNP